MPSSASTVAPTVLCILAASAGAQSPVETVILSDQQLPTMPEGLFYGGHYSARIDNTGAIAVSALLTGQGTNGGNNGAILGGKPGSLSILARQGASVLIDGGTATYGALREPVPHEGHVTFFTELSGLPWASKAIMSGAPGSLSPVAYTGQQAQGVPKGNSYFNLHAASHNATGVVFDGTMIGPGVENGDDSAVWAGQPGALSMIAREGDAAPGFISGVRYSTFVTTGNRAVIGAGGHIAFSGTVVGPGVLPDTDGAVWVGTPGNLQLAMREGSRAPQTGGAYFGYIHRPRLNATGRIVAGSTLTGPGVTEDNNQGIWTGVPGSLRLAARTGSQAPGAEAGVLFTHLGSALAPAIDDAGRIAFRAYTSGPDGTGSGVWYGMPDALRPVVLFGQEAPGIPGATLQPYSDSFFINNAGMIATLCILTGAGVTGANDLSIWAADASGDLFLLVREGNSLIVGPGDERTIKTIDLPFRSTGPGDGLGTPFNDHGQLLFGATFTDGTSGLFTATVPTPAALLPLLLGAAVAQRRRREASWVKS